jgi:regulator of sirC expression with transglutaminase-like and TPR domain
LLTHHLGDDEPYDATLLRPCTARLWMTRLLNNLKRAYVEQRSFRQAWQVADLVLATDASLVSERRDRGLLAYHLNDFPSALSDLEDYLRLTAPGDDEATDEREKIWEHVRALRRRVASLN